MSKYKIHFNLVFLNSQSTLEVQEDVAAHTVKVKELDVAGAADNEIPKIDSQRNKLYPKKSKSSRVSTILKILTQISTKTCPSPSVKLVKSKITEDSKLLGKSK